MVFGSPPVVLLQPPPPLQLEQQSSVAAVYLGTVDGAPWIREAVSNGDGCAIASLRSDDEAHCITTTSGGGSGGGGGGGGSASEGKVLIGTGAGLRGAIYGLYALSEHVLGVQPLHYFADLPPPPAYTSGTIDLAASNLPKLFTPKGFRVRALFLNDEDLLAGFGEDPLGDGMRRRSTRAAPMRAAPMRAAPRGGRRYFYTDVRSLNIDGLHGISKV